MQETEQGAAPALDHPLAQETASAGEVAFAGQAAPAAEAALVNRGTSTAATVDQAGSAPLSHADWWNSDAPAVEPVMLPGAAPATPYTDAQAAASLLRAGKVVVGLTAAGLPVAFVLGGWRSVAALAIGAAISGSGLWEWRRLMAALTARMDAAEASQGESRKAGSQAPSIGFAIAGFAVRLLLVLAILYGSLSYLHGSVAALAAGLAMGVVSLTIESVRLLRSGTI